jgi:hypothetical protein
LNLNTKNIMKPQIQNRSSERGTTLILTLVTCVIIGTTLASYLVMVEAQHRSTVRSLTWNTSMVLTEAGVEDGLQLLNKYSGDFQQLGNWVTGCSTDGWSSVSANVYTVTRYVGSNYYTVYITNSGVTPTINSQGYAVWNNAIASAPQSMFAAGGVSTATAMVSRSVAVNTKVDAIFPVAMAALGQIDLKGNNIATDSFDSGDPNFSNGGLYPYGNVSKTKANGSVVTDATFVNSLNVGNADIKGHVKTGPNGSVSIGPNGSVGDRAWVEGGSTGIEPGFSANDMNVLFPDVTLPNTTWTGASKTTGNGSGSQVNGVSYDYIFTTSGDYTIANLSGSVYVGTNVYVRLNVTGTVNLSGQDQIHIATGATLKWYQSGASASIQGNGVVNENGNASSFYYFGLPSNTSLSFGGNGGFTGAIYAPEADFTLGGGGNNTLDFIGASVSKTVTMNGHFNFHYDENLARNGMGRGYIATNWKEQPNSTATSSQSTGTPSQ